MTDAESVDYDETTDGPPEPVENPEATDVAQETTEDPQEAPEDAAEDSPGREAARWRRKLRETERERDTLAVTVTTMQRAEVERIAGAHVVNPAALWAAGIELDTLLDDDGRPDAARIREATTRAAEALGLARPLSNHVPREGSISPPSGGDSMVDAIMGRSG